MANHQVKVEVLNIDSTIKQMARYKATKLGDVKKIIKETANEVKKSAKAKAPYLTGATKASIGYKTSDGGFGMQVYPKKPKGYKAHWHEYGTVKMGATPFMTPAEKGAEASFQSKMRKLVNEEVTI